ncbi:MAG: chromosome partitioning protein ParB [Marinilabiliales bacterium]|nr:MAG: chromosome partitioning protein ParB [Marinilabiliales bacterium]
MTNSKHKKKALGRGLDAILSSPETDITSTDISGGFVAGAIAEIAISKIEVNPFQPRTDFDQMELRELADSIKVQGVIQPVTVRKLGFDKYQLIAGERRLRASQMAGLDQIPAFIRVANDEQMLELALIENIHRKDLNAIEVAISYKRLIEECNLTQEKLSSRLGRNRSTITNYLRLLKLPPKVQIALRDELITMGHARALITVEDGVYQERLLDRIIDEDLSVRQIEQLVREKERPTSKKPETAVITDIPMKYQETPNALSRKFGTKVRLRRNNKGAGSIVIKFNSDDELDHIISIIQD